LRSLQVKFFDFLLAEIHKLAREGVTAESIIVPTTYSIGNAESTLTNEERVLTVVRLLSDRVASRFYLKYFRFYR